MRNISISSTPELYPIVYWYNKQKESLKKYTFNKPSTNTFTGQHIVKPLKKIINKNVDRLIGKIVVGIGMYNNMIIKNNKANINDSMPIIEISKKEKDKRVIGVITNRTNKNEYISEEIINNGYIVINSLGDGMIWVSNKNGNFKNGDYITTSIYEGIGMKQSDNICHNYTVAKIMIDLDFENIKNILIKGKSVKVKMVPCIYLCG